MMVNRMSFVTLIIDALKFIFPAYCANAAPVLAGGGTAIDFGKKFFDGKPVFGRNKTFRGFFAGFAVGLFVGLVETCMFGWFPIQFSLLSPLGALIGDLAGAFAKRRLSIPPGGLLPVVDQVDFVLGALLFVFPFVAVSWQLALTVLLITPPVHLLTNFVAYKLGLKRSPW